MGQFFKFLLASCLGVFLAIGAITGIGALILTSIAASAEKPVEVKPNSVLHLTFAEPIPEHTNNVNSSPFDSGFEDVTVLGLHDMVDAIERATEDDNIKGIFLEPSLMFSAGFTTARSIREAIEDFKDSGKFVMSHSGFYTQGQYYLCSAANEIYSNPMGYFEVRGFVAQRAFYKDMLDRLGVKMQIFYAGKFKSATEPYRRDDMSPESKQQLREMLADYYGVFLDDVSQSRDMDRADLKRIVDEFLADTPENALENKLIDGIDYRENVIARMKERAGLDEDDKLPLVKLKDYNRSNPEKKNYKAKDRVAVVYAEGTIIDGKGQNGSTGDRKYVKDIRKLAKDDRVKAIVLRVNSPGGSALASENIWNAINLAKDNDKKVVVSMGDYAASGGYYIACNADSIFAQVNTLTGSIGIFRTIPVVGGATKKHLGISYDSVLTSPLAMPLNVTYEMSEAEKRKMQASTEQGYQEFLKRVAEGRDMTIDEVHKIAQGRVWTGQKAVKNGLVDRIGDLEDALASAANLAELDEYRIVEYPKVKDPLQQLIEDLMNPGSSVLKSEKILQKEFPSVAPYYKLLKEVEQAKGPQARMMVKVPFE